MTATVVWENVIQTDEIQLEPCGESHQLRFTGAKTKQTKKRTSGRLGLCFGAALLHLAQGVMYCYIMVDSSECCT